MNLFRRSKPQPAPTEEAEPQIDPVTGDPIDSNISVLEALVCETHSASLLTATIASAVNAFKRETTARNEAQIKPYIPREPAIISVLRKGMLEVDLDEETVAVVIEFFDGLGPARIALDQYFADANHIGAERASALHLLSLSTSWRQSCERALAATRKLNPYLGTLPDQYASNSQILTELLQEAIIGGSPCIDHKGRISLPDLPQRRRNARRTICQPCTLTHNRTTSEAFVRDVSPGGFGLERVPQLQPKSLVLIELPSGRRFTAVVAWCEADKAGVRFARTLLPNDPLLSGE